MLKITTHSKKHKMAGMFSLNTSTIENTFCQSMRKCEDTICHGCYAYSQTRRYKALELNNIANGTELSTTKIMPIYVPFTMFRFNSFGELINELHLENLIIIVKANPHCTFALWSKRRDIVKAVFTRIKKPVNMILIYSSPIKNVVSKKPVKFDKVFTVFTRPFIRDNGTSINCQQSCFACRICYTKNEIVNISESIR